MHAQLIRFQVMHACQLSVSIIKGGFASRFTFLCLAVFRSRYVYNTPPVIAMQMSILRFLKRGNNIFGDLKSHVFMAYLSCQHGLLIEKLLLPPNAELIQSSNLKLHTSQIGKINNPDKKSALI